MSAHAVIHLLPSVQPVAVCAEQTQVPLVGGPIFKPIVPYGSAAMHTRLLRWVNVVNIQNAVIRNTAMDARATQFSNKREFPTPVAMTFVLLEAVLGPMCQAAVLSAKAVFAFDPATFAHLLPLPSRRKVASASAVFPGAILKAVKMGFKRLLAVAAGDCNSALFHGRNIPWDYSKVNFDIACRRIEEAQRQGDLFIEGAAA